jgi:hypothetical protein
MCAQRGSVSGWANDPIRAAGGRRRWNAERQRLALERRGEVARLMRHYGLGRGAQTQMARELGVADSTISRDIRAILDILNASRCFNCGHTLRAASPSGLVAIPSDLRLT